jgi:excisionase family DNA binding protein
MPVNDWSSYPMLLSTRQAAEVLGVCVAQVRQLLKKDELPQVKVGKRCKISRDSLRRMIENHIYA